MINSVSSMSSSMAMMRSGATQRQPPPPDKDVFKAADSDSDGLVSSSELKTLAASIEKMTGNSIDVDDALASYDADQDGSLSGEELHGLLISQGFLPSEMIGNEDGDSGMMQPPKTEQALAAYAKNSGEDTISQLIALLKENSANAESFEVTA